MNDTEMTKEEAARILLAYAQINVETGGARDATAFLIGARCLLRAGIHKRRNHASRARRGLPPFCHEMSGSPSPSDEGRSRISSLDQRMLGKERAEAAADAECQSSAKTAPDCQPLATDATAPANNQTEGKVEE